MKLALVAGLLIILGAGSAYTYLKVSRGGSGERANASLDSRAFCAEHEIAQADCPWCDPGLIATRGQCAEHGVPEALCSRCNGELEAGFRKERDWCAGHGVPESQCKLCQAGRLPPGEEKQ